MPPPFQHPEATALSVPMESPGGGVRPAGGCERAMHGLARVLLVWLPALLAAVAGVLVVLVLPGFVPGSFFLPLALLVLAASFFLMLVRQSLLEETVARQAAEPRRLIAALRGRIEALERETLRLLETGPQALGATPAGGRATDVDGDASRTAEAVSARHDGPASMRPAPASPRRTGVVDHGTTQTGGEPLLPARPATAETTGATPVARRLEERGARLLAGFRLYMAPVIDRHHQRTALYRALPGLATEDGRVYLGADAMAQALRLGIAGQLDTQLLEATRHFAARLRRRGRPLPVICPLSTEFYIAPGARERLSALRAREEINLIAEMPQDALATLGVDGAELLAWLAGRGLRLCLGRADPRRMDAPALDVLGFAWADVPLPVLVESLDEGAPLPGRPEIIAAGVPGRASLERLPAMIRLVRGRAFAPPRRVRDEALRPPEATPGADTAAA